MNTRQRSRNQELSRERAQGSQRRNRRGEKIEEKAKKKDGKCKGFEISKGKTFAQLKQILRQSSGIADLCEFSG